MATLTGTPEDLLFVSQTMGIVPVDDDCLAQAHLKSELSDGMESNVPIASHENKRNKSVLQEREAFPRAKSSRVETPIRETIYQARRILRSKNVFEKYPELRELMQKTKAEAQRLFEVVPCPHCVGGQLHFVGRNRLPGRRVGMAGLVICDQCGHHEVNQTVSVLKS